MTKLTFTIALDVDSNLTVTETTGYYDAGTNPNGFLPEANSDAAAFGVYKLSQGYFLNVLLYNKYATLPLVINTAENFVPVATPINVTYANNFTPTVYKLDKDGTYTIERFFVISKDYYNAEVGSGLFAGKTIYYTDGTDIYTIIDSVATKVTVRSFLSVDLTNATAISQEVAFIATYHLSNCYFKLMSTLLESDLNNCANKDYDSLTQTKDLVYMTLEVIKYFKEVNNITQIQKLIEAVDTCCGVCSSLSMTGNTSSTSNSRSGCGCHG